MKRIQIDSLSKTLIFTSAAFTLVMENGWYLFFPILVLLVLMYYLQRPYTPAIFSFVLFFHFLQISAGVWYCNYMEVDINYDTDHRTTATIASSIGLLFLFLPIILFQNKIPEQTRSGLSKEITEVSTQRVMVIYIIGFFISILLAGVAFWVPGLTQIIYWLISIKWILFLFFGYNCIIKNEYRKIFFLFSFFEIILGFTSFFADFNYVFYFLIILFISLVEKINFKNILVAILISGGLISMAVVWTNVKDDYRKFLNKGQKSQQVEVERDEALDKLYDLTGDMEEKDINSSFGTFLNRLQYTYFFAKVMDKVPDYIEYQNGRNWIDNLVFTTTPRFLNPGKASLDQTEKTKKYTGLYLSGSKKGVSFSLGYFAECYIDLGLYGMNAILLLIGILFGAFYWFLLKKSSDILIFNYCVVGAFFMEFVAYASDGTYLLGRFISGVVTYVLLVKFFFPWLMPILKKTYEKD